MANKLYQRKGVSSNTQAGKDFENYVFNFFELKGIHLESQKKVEIGINAKKKKAFDFGNNSILIECKSQTWTETGKTPSAKIKNWSDAMFCFYLAPKNTKKLFCVEMSFNQKNCKTLVDYFIEHYYYLIPSDVVLIDFYTENDNYEVYMFDEISKIHIHKDKKDLWNYLNS